VADIQKHLVKFHEEIKLRRFDENEVLLEKRDRVLEKLDAGLKLLREEGEEIPTYTPFNQGSYAMGTGVKPLDRDYDIDVGLEFDLAKDDHSDPVKVKDWVLRALEGHTKRVEMRRPCVTVFYQQDGESVYHVDLAIYSPAQRNPGKKNYLAKGKLNSDEKHRVWQESDPKELMDLIGNRFKGDDDKQFRRVIRYLKRWKDERFPSEGNGAPPGIALTVAAYYWFSTTKKVDSISNQVRYDDLGALHGLLHSMQGQFSSRWDSELNEWVDTLEVKVPVAPYDNLLERLTGQQMKTFKEKLDSLLEAVEEAQSDVDEHSACKILRAKFGEDFPIPDKSENAKTSRRAIVSSGNSA
jgi:hypothetical protein